MIGGLALAVGSILGEGFDGPGLDPALWVPTALHDLRSGGAAVVPDPGSAGGGRLALRLDTMGTADDTVKFVGVRSARPLDFGEGLVIEYTLDWNDPANGCYLTAGVFLTAEATDGSAEGSRDWIAFQYVGTPPGRNGRGQIAIRRDGALRFLETEGWPHPDPAERTGRKLGAMRVRWEIDATTLVLHENGREYWRGRHGLPFTKATLHLEASSHNNYPLRTVYFDDVSVRPVTTRRRAAEGGGGAAGQSSTPRRWYERKFTSFL